MTRLFRDTDGSCLAPHGSVVCIGAFDGVHRGHEALLARVRERARATGRAAVALGFEPLPRQHFLGRGGVARLSRPAERIERLGRYADLVGLLRFDARLAATEAEDFVRRVLVARLATREVWVGPGFRFGRARRGDVALLRALGAEHAFGVHEIEPVLVEGERASATRVRELLAAGDFDAAATLLGRRYAMSGRVVHGRKLGRQLGYPTANLALRWGRAPVHGIFAVRVHGAGLRHWPAVASLGTRPTVAGVEPLLEVHLFDFDGDLYGQRLAVEFVAKIRDEAKFDSLDALTAQMHRDAADARAALRRDVSLEEALVS
jgi:riboflavin kinase/FMN adenylyltransferase